MEYMITEESSNQKEMLYNVLKEIDDKTGFRLKGKKKSDLFELLSSMKQDSSETILDNVFMVLQTLVPEDVISKSETIKPAAQRLNENINILTEKFLSGNYEFYGMDAGLEDMLFLYRKLGFVKSIGKRIGKELAIPIKGKMINYESDLLRLLRKFNPKNIGLDGDVYGYLHPLQFTKFPDGLVIDFDRRFYREGCLHLEQRGDPIRIYKTGGRTCSLFEDKKVLQFKGGFLDKTLMGNTDVSNQTLGVFTYANGLSECQNMEIIGKDILKCDFELYDLGDFRIHKHYVEDLINNPDYGEHLKQMYEGKLISPWKYKDGEDYIDTELCVLKRIANTEENNIHIRMSNVLQLYDLVEKTRNFFNGLGIDMRESFRKAGEITRISHDKSVFPLYNHLGNISVDGYLLDFEGALNETNIKDYLYGNVTKKGMRLLKLEGISSTLNSIIDYSKTFEHMINHVEDFAEGYTNGIYKKGSLTREKIETMGKRFVPNISREILYPS